MHLNFIIIDDQKSVLQNICRNIKKFIKENRLEARVSLCTTTPEDVLDYAKVHFNQMNVYIVNHQINSF